LQIKSIRSAALPLHFVQMPTNCLQSRFHTDIYLISGFRGWAGIKIADNRCQRTKENKAFQNNIYISADFPKSVTGKEVKTRGIPRYLSQKKPNWLIIIRFKGAWPRLGNGTA